MIDYENHERRKFMNNHENLRKERNMKVFTQKFLKSTLAVMMMFGMLVSSMSSPLSVNALDVPLTGGAVEIEGKTTVMDVEDLKNGDRVTIKFEIYTDPLAYDCLYAANFAMVYDSAVFDFMKAEFFLEDGLSTIHVAPFVKSSTQINLLLANWQEVPSNSAGFLGTMVITLEVKDESKLLESLDGNGEFKFELELFNEDLTLLSNGNNVDYYYVYFPFNATPMILSVTGLPEVNLSSLEDVQVEKGGSHQFAITVTGGTTNTVTWSLTGATSSDTKIDQNGLLVVGDDETSTTLIVSATSDDDQAKVETVNITVAEKGTPPVTNPGTPNSPNIPNTGVLDSVLPYVGIGLATLSGLAVVLKKKKNEEE